MYILVRIRKYVTGWAQCAPPGHIGLSHSCTILKGTMNTGLKNEMSTVSQERLQPMSDGKRHFIVGYFLCYSYKLILISPGIFHRALFEKWLTLVAEKSPESAKFTYSNLEAFNVHPPSYVILILKKMPFFIILLYPLPDKSPHLAAENLWILWK